MRVIAGEAKGRRLTALRSASIRPTSDRVREAMFSTIGDRVVGATVLDLYAGSGALGIEALSRGAAGAVFVDSGRDAVEAIRANVALTRFEGRSTILRSSAAAFLASRRPAPREGPFGLVLLDPPYAQGPPVEDLRALAAGELLGAGALVVVETEGPDAPPPVAGLELVSLRRYGDSTLVFLRSVLRGSLHERGAGA